ncbi:hypothetical protein OHU34_31530 [Streptomyces sp. NBC_00080]|uniref:hypothetical protein n=1 Tax=unclassified Streptomyces TaxID=2593676 RepID=UPI00114E21E6|nr:hypothetical protein [Streptomyces sp. SLBN-115]TQJ48333.1 hypothetical protein FBY34_7789 [Streptomyces sp. SLBN-115]
MGIRMLHRRKSPARVHTAAADTRSGPGAAPRTRPRPALAPGAAGPRIPWSPGAALREAAARLRGPAITRFPLRFPPRVLTRFLDGFVSRNDSRWRLWAEAVRGHPATALGVLGRLRGRRTVRRIPLFVATAPPVTERPGDSAAH